MDQPVLLNGKRRSALVLYGSETGTAQDVAEEVGKLCQRLRFATHVCALDDIGLQQLLKNHFVICCISTTGQGALPTNAQTFWKRLRSVRLPPSCLASLQFTSFGLAERFRFNFAHRKLYNRLIQLGAQPLYQRGESDEQHPEGVDGTLIPWLAGLKDALAQRFPLPTGIEPIADSVAIPPKWRLHFVNDRSPEITDAGASTGNPPDDLIAIKAGMTATVHSNERMTATSHFQDTRHVILTVPGNHNYPPGAVLTIFPKNFPSDVCALLDLMSWTAIADQPVKFVQTATDVQPSDTSVPPVDCPGLTLRILLTNHLDIMTIPRRSFFTQLQQHTTDEMHLERLQDFTNPDLVDELYDYTIRPRRSILETLSDFPKVKIPWQDVCNVIPLMRGRQFSIASGGALKSAESLSNGTGACTRVDLLVAIVKYKTIIKRIRQGVATRYISSLQAGQKITVTLQSGGLGLKPGDYDKPVVMIGPGTGVAPMRSLMYEKSSLTSSATLHNGVRDVLFYGCRNRNVDEYFQQDWPLFNLNVYCAYSRDEREKFYVQDMIRQKGAQVYNLIAERGGIVFVCGSSGRMPQAVRQALTDTFVQHGSMSLDDAESFLVRLEKEGRYLQETW